MSEKKTVFISGCSRGIGKATVEYYAEQGWNVIAHARKETKEFIEFANKLSETRHVKIIPIYFDMCDEIAMKEQVKKIISNQKIGIDALVNNAGICDIKLFLMTSISSVRELYEINLFSHMRLTQLLLKRMPVGGSIINVASIDGYKPQCGESGYATSKAAMIAWTEVLQQELNGRIRVNAIAPGAVNTDMAHSIAEKANWKEDSLIDPLNVARVIYFLSTDDASGINGEIVRVLG